MCDANHSTRLNNACIVAITNADVNNFLDLTLHVFQYLACRIEISVTNFPFLECFQPFSICSRSNRDNLLTVLDVIILFHMSMEELHVISDRICLVSNRILFCLGGETTCCQSNVRVSNDILMALDQHKAHDWLRSYLGKRCQSIDINGCKSQCLPLIYGVPQGSLTHPSSHNKLCLCREHGVSYQLYADDT